jgi:hypothetical protein
MTQKLELVEVILKGAAPPELSSDYNIGLQTVQNIKKNLTNVI